MKFSEAVIKGYETNGGQQTHNGAYRWGDCLCVLGAALVGSNEDDYFRATGGFPQEFYEAVGVYPQDLNDEGMDWRDIVGIAIAEGL